MCHIVTGPNMAVRAARYILTFYHHHFRKSMHIAQVSYSYKANSYFVLQVSFQPQIQR